MILYLANFLSAPRLALTAALLGLVLAMPHAAQAGAAGASAADSLQDPLLQAQHEAEARRVARGYANRTSGSRVLEFDLRLEGMTIVKDNLFTGQHLRLSGVAFLWYRVYEPDGKLVLAKATRRITEPVEVDLRGSDPSGDFWSAPPR